MKTNLKIAVAVAGLLCFGAVAANAETIHSVTQISYNVRNQPVCTAVRMNTANFGSLPADACALGAEGAVGPDRITKNSYNSDGELIQVDQAYGTTVQRAYARYTYTVNGLKATEKDAKGNLTTLEYDGFDRLKKLRYPSTTVGAGTSSTTDYEDYGYDNNDNKTSWRRRDGNTLLYTYDNLNRETVRDIPGGTAQDVYTGYNGLGQVAYKRFASLSGSGVSYIYDSLGRVTSTTDINGRTVGYAYNVASARISLIYPDLNTVGYGLDNANRLTNLGWNATSGLYGQTFDSLGRLSAESKWGGSTSYTYDGIGRLASKTNNVLGTTYDGSWSFTYNPANQIQSSASSSTVYDYDQINSATENRTFDGLNRDTGIVSVGGYDLRGNLTYEGSGGRTMTYDVENRLLTVLSAGANVKLDYDPEGRLYRYSADGGSNWTTFLYDGVNLIGEYAGTSVTPLRRYIHGPGTDNPVIWFEGAGITAGKWYYTNRQGSVVGLADGGGNPTDLYRYDPYGVPTDLSNNSAWWGSRFRYTGQVMLPEAKLYYYKARVYDPIYGRFLQTDPIGSGDDLNLYAYVSGDPVNGADPTGLAGEEPPPITITGHRQRTCDLSCQFIMLNAQMFSAVFVQAFGQEKHARLCITINNVRTNGCVYYTYKGLRDLAPPIHSNNDAVGEQPEDAPDIGDFDDVNNPPEGWEWRGRGAPGSRDGAWHNPGTDESLHDDRTHPAGKPPHVTWTDKTGKRWDNFGDGWVPQRR